MQPLAPPARIRRDYDVQRRHLPRVRRCADDLLRFACAAPESLQTELDRRLRSLFAQCWNVPYYQDLFTKRGFGLFDARGMEDLASLPLLPRSTLAQHWTRMLSVEAGQNELCAVLSSGSAGEPLRVLKDGFDQVHMWACLRFWMRWLGLEAAPRVALLDSLPGGLEYEASLPLFHDGELRRISLVQERPLERLAEFMPSVVFTDPAGLHAARSVALPGVVLWLSSSQYLPPDVRGGFAAPLLNYYATTESGPIAFECLREAGRFHVMAPDMFVESVAGELVVTRLRESAFPLLRYQTGDQGMVGLGHCSCGARGWWIEGFSGRRACLFRTPAGTRVDAWQLAWLFKQRTLSEFRFTQVQVSRFALELVEPTDGQSLLRELTCALQVLGWPQAEVQVRGGVTLPPMAKPQPFVCECP